MSLISNLTKTNFVIPTSFENQKVCFSNPQCFLAVLYTLLNFNMRNDNYMQKILLT